MAVKWWHAAWEIPGAILAFIFIRRLVSRSSRESDTKDMVKKKPSCCQRCRDVVRVDADNSMGELPANHIHLLSWNLLRANYRFNSHQGWIQPEHKAWSYRRGLHSAFFSRDKFSFILAQEIEDPDEMDVILNGGLDGEPLYKYISGGSKSQHSFTRPRVYYDHTSWELVWSEARSRIVLGEFKRIGTDSSPNVFVVSVHLTGGPSEASRTDRQKQLLSAHKYLKKRVQEDSYVIIGGDFNCDEWRVKDIMDETWNVKNFLCEHLSYQTMLWGPPATRRSQILDRVLGSNNIELVQCRTPFTESQQNAIDNECGIPNAFHPSDHVPVCITLNLTRKS